MIKGKFKSIYRFHKLAFDRGDSIFDCFNRASINYVWVVVAGSSQISYEGKRLYMGLWQPVLVRFHTRECDYAWVVTAGSSQISYEGSDYVWVVTAGIQGKATRVFVESYKQGEMLMLFSNIYQASIILSCMNQYRCIFNNISSF